MIEVGRFRQHWQVLLPRLSVNIFLFFSILQLTTSVYLEITLPIDHQLTSALQVHCLLNVAPSLQH